MATFNQKIEQELKNLTKEQVIHFAWLCAVRALPFIGSKGSFDYWKKNDRQRHLYSIFYALDVNLIGDPYSTLADDAANYVTLAYDDVVGDYDERFASYYYNRGASAAELGV